MTDPQPPTDGARSGRAFVLACAALCAALVLVFVFVSPRLLQATLEDAPDRAPVEVAAGEVDGRAWRVTAVQREERGCAEIVVDGQRERLVCGDEDGPSGVRGMDAIPVGDAALVAAVVDPRSSQVSIAHDGGTARAEVVHADFGGFPLGVAAAAVTPPVDRLSAHGDQGRLRGRADCRLDGDDHDPQRHLAPPILVGTGDVLTGGCLLTD